MIIIFSPLRAGHCLVAPAMMVFDGASSSSSCTVGKVISYCGERVRSTEYCGEGYCGEATGSYSTDPGSER